jgi:hypothetical protein
MSKKEEFKDFVRKNPNLIKHVKSNDMTWQKFYELWDLYGEDNKVWNDYKEKEEATKDSAFTLGTLLSSLKNINMDTVQKNLGGIQKAVEFFQDTMKKDDKKTTYEPRPLFRKFED